MEKGRYGLIAVIVGVVAIAATPAVAALVLGMSGKTAADIQTIAGPAVSAMAAITAAYFGINLGQEGKAEAEAKKDEAKEKEAAARAEAAAAKATALSYGEKAGVTPTEVEARIRQVVSTG